MLRTREFTFNNSEALDLNLLILYSILKIKNQAILLINVQGQTKQSNPLSNNSIEEVNKNLISMSKLSSTKYTIKVQIYIKSGLLEFHLEISL